MNNYNEVRKNYKLWYEDLKNKTKFEKKRKEFSYYHIKRGVVRVQIEPTNRCNYSCIMCPINEFDKKKAKLDMNFENFKIIADKLPSTVTNICLSGLGEPFLNKEYIKMAKYAKEKGYYTEVYNNGSLFDQAILPYIGEINFSVDSPDKELLSSIRKGIKIDKLFESIKVAVKNKTKYDYKVNINFTANYKNYKDIKNLYDLANELNIDELYIQATANNYSPQSIQYMEFKKFVKKNKLIDWKFIAEQYKKTDKFKLTIWYPRKMKSFCSWTFSNVYINKNSEIISCCQKVTNPTIFGDLKQKNFADIYNGEKMKNFRYKHINKQNINICNNCPY